MRNHEYMLNRVVEGECDDGTVSACLDAIREEMGESLLFAVLRIGECIRLKATAADLTAAAELLAPRSVHRPAVRAIILAHVAPTRSPEAVVYLFAGDAPPRIASTTDGYREGFRVPVDNVTVGASWLIREWAETLATVGRVGGPVLHRPPPEV